MSIKINARAADPDEIPVQLRITMTVAEWKQMKAQMSSNYPSWKLTQAINSLVFKFEMEFVSEDEIQS